MRNLKAPPPSDISPLHFSAFNSSQPEEEEDDSQPNISIQIEVDIEPPEEPEGEKLSEEELEQLGLPARHIHYTAAGVGAGPGAGENKQEAELLQPADIQLTFADTERRSGGESGDGSLYNNQVVSVPELEYEDPEPPLALPETSLSDNIYSLEAFCGLDCGPGRCKIDGRREKVCLCPLGRTGAQCQQSLQSSGAPRLSGLSHFSLPTLQNAYSDLHLALDFKPSADSGVLLITGQTDDMTGDYLALILTDGYVELRYPQAPAINLPELNFLHIK